MQRGGESTACALFMDGISEGQKWHKRDVQGLGRGRERSISTTLPFLLCIFVPRQSRPYC